MAVGTLRAAVCICVILAAPTVCSAIDASNVLLLYTDPANDGTSDGAQIEAAYVAAHPGVHVLKLTNVPSGDEITADQYLGTIRPQVVAGLAAIQVASPGVTINDIVTTKGLPVRINVTQQFGGGTPSYQDPFGVVHNVYTQAQYSSMESELTRVGTISTWQQMRDQTWWDPTIPSQAVNPYYNYKNSATQDSAFDHGNAALGGMYLTSRLDGYNAAEVIASLGRAQKAYSGPFNYVVDNDPTKLYNSGMASLVNNVLIPQHQPYSYDNTAAFVGTAPGPVLGYVSFGANQVSTPPNFMLDTTGGLQFPIANGAVAETWESYNAFSFTQGGNHYGQSLIADWIHRGGTAAVGNVHEPWASLTNVGNDDIMFNMLLHGYTWGEAAWAAMRQLSYVNTVVGDPLMVWKPAFPGDINGDGTVGAADLAILSKNWGATGPGGGALWGQGDFDGDGRVGASDMAIFSANWGKSASWVNGGVIGQGFGGVGGGGGAALAAIPEPSSLLLAALAVAMAAPLVARRRATSSTVR